MLASTGGKWTSLDQVMGEDHGISFAVSRRTRRRKSG